MKIRSLMTEAVKSCGPDTNLSSVIETMRTCECGIVPVVNDRGEAVGVVTDRDICLTLGARDEAASALVARDVMAHPVISCAPEDECIIALLTMAQHRVRRLPVLGIGGVLLGIVSIDDVLGWAARAPSGDPLRAAVLEVVAGLGHAPRPPTFVRPLSSR
jgi:CBS domain-containing protein